MKQNLCGYMFKI